MKLHKPSPAQAVTYFFAFALPALSLGLLLLMVTASDLMIRPTPTPLQLADAPRSASHSGGKRAWIIAGNGGVQISELLVAYEILAASGAFRIDLVAPQRVLSPTTSDVSFMPTATWREKTEAAEIPDLVVIPSALDPGQSEVVASLRTLGMNSSLHRAPVIAVLSEGARLASEAGLMAGKRATSHFLALRDLRKAHPETTWLRDTRAVVDGRLVSSSSVASAPVALLAALELATSLSAAQAVAKTLGYSDFRNFATRSPFPEGTTPGEFLQLILHGGYDFYKRETAVWLAPGVSESSLAAALDVLPRTFSSHVYSVATARDWTTTQHGLPLIAGHALKPEPQRPVETLIIPQGAPAGDLPATLAAWIAPYAPTVEDLRSSASTEGQGNGGSVTLIAGETLPRMLALSARLEGETMTAYAAKMMGAEPVSGMNGFADQAAAASGGGAPAWSLWLRPLLAGALGVWLVWTFRRWSRRLATPAATVSA